MSSMQATSLGWAPAIPSRWKIVPLNFVAKMGTGHTPDRNKAEYWESCTIPWVTTPDVTRRADSLAPLMETEQQISELGMANSAAVLHPTDTVMLSRTASVGYSVRIGRPMATTQAFVTWHAGPDLDPRYLLLVLRAMKQEWQKLAYGSTHLTIYMPDLESIRIPLPPLEEQRRIADFLDAETARIDQLVHLRSKQSSLIGEGLAAEAVGLTGRSQIRRGDCTTESLIQLRRAVISTQTGSTPANLRDLSDGGASEDDVPWYTPASIDSWMSITTAEKATHRNDAPLFPAGSVIITGIGESLGKVAYLDHVATGNQQLTAITPTVGVSGRFMAWQLWAAEQEIREWAQYSRIRIINNDSLKSFPIYLPSRAEQDTVVRTLDSRMVRVRQIKDAFLRFQRLADERRQALITAAVTGQFDVSTAIGRNVTDGVTA
ncbi:restriction endonuclease subunit S [Streptomyces hydrogenans]|uniref:restriction endonuclease subunit S n=1 Tax=Streptomyces hydrogenans TaxID=1873719 RepID=UPI0035D87929